jgi:hypothetical protein
MRKEGIKNYVRVSEIISDYHKNPEKILKMAGISK